MADFLATNEFAGTGAVMQVEVNFAGTRVDLPNQPAPYLEADDVLAAIVTPATNTTVEVVTPTPLTQINALTFRTTVVVPVGQTLRVYRSTDIEYPLVDFVSLQVVTESDLDSQARQTLYAVMEAEDNAQIAIRTAGGASDTATQAFVLAENAVETADAATVTANQAAADATQAVDTANSADSKANQALANAAAAEQHAEAVEVLAQQAGDSAAAAAQSAADANTAANQAISTANGIDGKAQQALDNSAAAIATANGAAATANNIDGKAQTALDTANTANQTANSANATANAAQSSVNAALTGKQDHATRLDSLVNLAATVGTYTLVALNGGGSLVAEVKASSFMGTTFLPSSDAESARTNLGLGTGNSPTFAGLATTGNVVANGYVAANTMGTVSGASVNFTGGITAAGTIRSNSDLYTKQHIAISSATAAANAHLWFHDESDNERALIYADTGRQLHIRANAGSVGEVVVQSNNHWNFPNGAEFPWGGRMSIFYCPTGAAAGMYGACNLQLQGTNGGVAALGFHNAGRVALALWLTDANELQLMKNNGANSEMIHSGNLGAWMISALPGEAIGQVSSLQNTTGTNIGINGQAAGSGLRYSSHNNVSTAPPGTWRCLGWSNNGGVSTWQRVG